MLMEERSLRDRRDAGVKRLMQTSVDRLFEDGETVVISEKGKQKKATPLSPPEAGEFPSEVHSPQMPQRENNTPVKNKNMTENKENDARGAKAHVQKQAPDSGTELYRLDCIFFGLS